MKMGERTFKREKIVKNSTKKERKKEVNCYLSSLKSSEWCWWSDHNAINHGYMKGVDLNPITSPVIEMERSRFNVPSRQGVEIHDQSGIRSQYCMCIKRNTLENIFGMALFYPFVSIDVKATFWKYRLENIDSKDVEDFLWHVSFFNLFDGLVIRGITTMNGIEKEWNERKK